MKTILFAVVLACAACGTPSSGEREVRRQRLESEHRALIAELDALQARLLVDRGRVAFWEEIHVRHQGVSAVACNSQETHAVAMAEELHLLGTEEGRHPARSGQTRVAALSQR
jgi:hypothetical protein